MFAIAKVTSLKYTSRFISQLSRPLASKSSSVMKPSNSKLMNLSASMRCLSSTQTSNNPADKTLSQFLAKEISLEKNLTQVPKQGLGIPGFEVEQNGAVLTLTRSFRDEKIAIKVNVNGSVDSEEQENGEMKSEKAGEEPPAVMKCKPEFVIEITKPSGTVLTFTCTIYGNEPEIQDAETNEAGDSDLFQIDSFFVRTKEQAKDADWKPEIYMADGGLIDGDMYDMLMNLLEERGIDQSFAEALIEYSTYYEHDQHIKLLEALKTFVDEQ